MLRISRLIRLKPLCRATALRAEPMQHSARMFCKLSDARLATASQQQDPNAKAAVAVTSALALLGGLALAEAARPWVGAGRGLVQLCLWLYWGINPWSDTNTQPSLPNTNTGSEQMQFTMEAIDSCKAAPPPPTNSGHLQQRQLRRLRALQVEIEEMRVGAQGLVKLREQIRETREAQHREFAPRKCSIKEALAPERRRLKARQNELKKQRRKWKKLSWWRQKPSLWQRREVDAEFEELERRLASLERDRSRQLQVVRSAEVSSTTHQRLSELQRQLGREVLRTQCVHRLKHWSSDALRLQRMQGEVRNMQQQSGGSLGHREMALLNGALAALVERLAERDCREDRGGDQTQERRAMRRVASGAA